MDFERINPVALVSGATFGAGAAIAPALAYGADGGLILIDSDSAALDALADKLGDLAPERVSLLSHDGGDDAQWWERVRGFIKDQYGRLDWAVINVCPPPTSTDASDLIDFSRDGGALQSAQRALRTIMPLMRFNSQGGAVTIVAPSATLKGDLLRVIATSAKEGAEDHIRVNAVTLGAAAGTMQSFQDMVRDTGSERAAFEILSNLAPPLARLGPVQDLKSLIIPMLTGLTPITGVTLVVDEGYAL